MISSVSPVFVGGVFIGIIIASMVFRVLKKGVGIWGGIGVGWGLFGLFVLLTVLDGTPSNLYFMVGLVLAFVVLFAHEVSSYIERTVIADDDGEES